MAREYSPEVKAEVMAELFSGQSASGVAAKFGIPRGTVAAWQTRKVDPIVATVAKVAAENKREEVKELLVELLITQLKSQIAMAEHASDKEWLLQQRADSVAILLGVVNDKVWRLLDALNGGGASAGSESGSASD